MEKTQEESSRVFLQRRAFVEKKQKPQTKIDIAFARSAEKILMLLWRETRIICWFCFRAKRGENFDFAFARSAMEILTLLSREARRTF